MDRCELTGAVFIDLQKVFDTVEHSILLSKLRIYNDELKWLCSYLTGRFQFVQYGNSLSETKAVKFGVPQGSILGPLLFLLHINDLAKCIKKCNLLMYADDAIIYTSHSSFQVIETILTTDIKGISERMNENRLIINLKKGKTESMLFGTAKRLTATVPLEIVIDDKLINFTSYWLF